MIAVPTQNFYLINLPRAISLSPSEGERGLFSRFGVQGFKTRIGSGGSIPAMARVRACPAILSRRSSNGSTKLGAKAEASSRRRMSGGMVYESRSNEMRPPDDLKTVSGFYPRRAGKC
jgi:hypothetical protein